jgi:hypothetical protein
MLHCELLYITTGMVRGWAMMACGEKQEPIGEK